MTVSLTATNSGPSTSTPAGGILLGFAGLQIALAAGAPLGEHVWGGTQERLLPSGLRAVAGGSAVALTAAAGVVARRAGLAGRPALSTPRAALV